jgi:RND family efflux transporter MFP subunit
MNVIGKWFSLRWMLFVLVLLPAQTFAEEISATLQWVRTVPLSTTVSGVIEWVNVAQGDRVRSGKELLNLVDATFQADVLARRAGVKKAKNNNDEARRELERTQELYDRTLLSDHDLQLATIQYDAAGAELQVAHAALSAAERDHYYSVIRAPFDAWVLQRNAQPGQAVIVKLQAIPLLVLAEAGRMLARATVGVATVGSIKRGNKARVWVAGKSYDGKIHTVAMEPVGPGVDEYVVDVLFVSGPSVLRVGQSARVSF